MVSIHIWGGGGGGQVAVLDHCLNEHQTFVAAEIHLCLDVGAGYNIWLLACASHSDSSRVVGVVA